MIILHYALGFPPYRTGGLTKFCMDIMKQQFGEGDDVSLLWPGQMGFINRKVEIKKRRSIEMIKSYELCNPLPIALDEGVVNFFAFTKSVNIEIYINFLNYINPDVIHIHTLMGLHREFVEAAKEIGIRTVFTTHDFYGLCPKATMFRNGQICNCDKDCSHCASCNKTALSLNKIRFLQSRFYQKFKNTFIVEKMRKRHRDIYFIQSNSVKQCIDIKDHNNIDYVELQNYYISIIKLIDIIHFNSTVTEGIYKKYVNLKKSKVVGITHSNISDNRKKKKFTKNIKITYLGAQRVEKGFFILKAALDELWDKQHKFILNVYFEPCEKTSYIRSHKKYTYTQLEEIFDETDLLVAPSLLYETFGFTVLEAVSFGTPVLISSFVGAKDVIPEGAGIVIEEISINKLKNTIKDLNIIKLTDMNKTILEAKPILTIEKLSLQIKSLFYL